MDPIISRDLESARKIFPVEVFNEKSILVTGGAGFIGSWLCDLLVSCGARVICLDNLSTGKIENVSHLLKDRKMIFIERDVSQPQLFDDPRFDMIFHLASRPSPEEYQLHPIQTLVANSIGSQNMLELARLDDARILYTSTSEVYGNSDLIPTPETYWGNVNPIGPRSCYDEGKRFGEALFKAYEKEYGIDIRITRIFNTYGPRIRADGVYGRALSRFLMQAMRGQDITVYGDGSQTRSFCYITDIMNGILLASMRQNARGEIINLGNPKETSILSLAQIIRGIAKSKSNIVFKSLPQDDPVRRCPNINKAWTLLGWRPLIDLNEGLAKTLRWFQNVSP